MKYQILGYNQEAIIDYKLKLEDIHILRWIADFMPKMKSIVHNNKEYYWVSYSAIVKDLPILNIGHKQIAYRLRKMRKLDILDMQTRKHSHGTWTFYRFSEGYEKLMSESFLDYQKDKKNLPTTAKKEAMAHCQKNSSHIHTTNILHTTKEEIFTNVNSPDPQVDRQKKSFELNQSEYDLLLPIFTHWNNQEELTTHKFPDSPGSRCSQLVYNTAQIVKKIINNEYYDKLSLPDDLRNMLSERTFNTELILDTINTLKSSYSPNMMPKNKNYLPKDIVTFFYNVRTEFSYFLKFIKECGVTPIKDAIVQEEESKVPENILKLYKPLFRHENAQTNRLVARKLPKLIEFYNSLDKDLELLYSHRGFNNKFGSVNLFCRQHISYLNEYYGGKRMTAGHLNTHGNVWEAFLSWIKDHYSISFTLSNSMKAGLWDQVIVDRVRKGELTGDEANELMENENPYR